MSINSDEVNYLVWRYLQESGLEVSAFALSDESTVQKFDKRYGESIPIGSLVNLLQKGILYSQADQLVKQNGDVQEDKFYDEKFSVFHALNADSGINPPLESKDRFAKIDPNETNEEVKDKEGDHVMNGDENGHDTKDVKEQSPDFIKILKKKFTFEPSTYSDFNPTASTVLSFGLSDARAKIAVILPNSEIKPLILNHPPSSSFNTSNDVTILKWSPMGNLLVTGVESGELRLWAADGKLINVLYLHHSPILILKWSPSGKYLLSSDINSNLIIWDVTTGNIIMDLDLLKKNETTVHNESDETINLGIDATWIDDSKFIIPGLNGSVLVFNIDNKTPWGTLIGHTKAISSIKYNKENSMLLTSSDDRTIRIWNGNGFNNCSLLSGHSQPVTYSDWITNDFIISCSLDGSLRIWDINFSKQTSIIVMDGVPILHGELSPDKKSIAVGNIEGEISIFSIDLLLPDEQLKLIGEYQPLIPNDDLENNLITSLKWSSDSKDVVVTYSHSESVVVSGE
ncbi:putative WD repeat-containing protein [Wickerhamomyces ciferrii]|uniref:WD repeat-containing protein n=1 Tax=Wickerhamomyces ciferrii (strain ATCC 14091 / BCRC 22168 / CBS 111 / JCM 3599 / NBRC 0793 / NRRL Y-1031 F-60-10) TaxID=1206466 RepID=K0KY14_WICCF|nr:putative WD repeat-containing protein [Wickerhamomyces ciferrii]CCH45983.1 putative WD repeat-containing protein [Wickerhamomyces ciferrii]